jgi:cytoskeletal protein CcmA (bactofilin family)
MERPRQVLCLLLILSTFPAVALAKKNPERTQFGRDIRVEVGEETGELTCMNCSIYIRGKVDGDATAFHGSIVVEPDAEITGAATAFLGGIRVEPGASISGDATAFAGAVRTQGQARIGGDRTSFEGRQWLAAIVVAPLAILAAIIALVVWLVQRSRRDVNMPVRQTSMG